jgi:hypothetical protein
MRSTKTVWPIKSPIPPLEGGSTCDDPGYLDWVRSLQAAGFEIALHCVSHSTSARAEVERGLRRFEALFGAPPAVHANHYGCDDNLYWGSARLTGMARVAYDLMTRYRNTRLSHGHIPGSGVFWGDLCRERVRYVRNFVYPEINTLKACPWMPYHDPLRPYVAQWFAGAEAAEVNACNAMLNERNQDRLAEDGGACVLYTHFGSGFVRDGVLDARFRALMRRLTGLNGWFVPVSTLLDHIAAQRGPHILTSRERAVLEWRWLYAKLRQGGSS